MNNVIDMNEYKLDKLLQNPRVKQLFIEHANHTNPCGCTGNNMDCIDCQMIELEEDN